MTDPFGGLEPAPGRALVVESRYTKHYNVWEITNTDNGNYPDRHWIAPNVASAIAILRIYGKEVV
jgi:hypothetical protein